MPTNATVLSLFLAGAQDVADEQAIVRQVVDEWNRHGGLGRGAFVTVTSWHTHSYPDTGAGPQAVINRQVVDVADIVVGIFWTRFGTPTASAGSGTEEEIERSISAGKKVLIYFSDRPISPSAFDSAEYERVKLFKQKYSKRGLYHSYTDLADFRDSFRGHLMLLLKDLPWSNGLSRLSPSGGDDGGEIIQLGMATAYWVVTLAAIEQSVKLALKEAEVLRLKGISPDDVTPAERTALTAPLLIRGFIVDVLVKHGVLQPDAAQKGLDALMRIVGHDQAGRNP